MKPIIIKGRPELTSKILMSAFFKHDMNASIYLDCKMKDFSMDKYIKILNRKFRLYFIEDANESDLIHIMHLPVNKAIVISTETIQKTIDVELINVPDLMH